MKPEFRGKIFTSPFISWQDSLRPLLELSSLKRRIDVSLIFIKPNLAKTLAIVKTNRDWTLP